MTDRLLQEPVPVHVRRPHLLLVERRHAPAFSFEDLLAGGAGVVEAGRWVALAPHLDDEVELGLEEMAVLEALPAQGETELAALFARFGEEPVRRLLDSGLLLGEDQAHAQLRARDEAFREGAWWAPAAIVQAFGRWQGVDVSGEEARQGARTLASLIEANGLPPPAALARTAPESRVRLPTPTNSDFDELLGARTTCRNFDVGAAITAAQLATMLQRVFGAQGSEEPEVGVTMLKKHSPSGGGLHPVEAYLLVQRAQGVAPGLYHYHALEHALEPLRGLEAADAARLARELVAGQDWFADAPVLVLMAARFARTFWKYRNHPKSWKVVQLDAGHLSQTWQLSATELGLGAFITAAINDRCAEDLFGFDGRSEGAIAVCGVGPRAAARTHFEFDPNGKALR
jgi:putative peptide maturation dehydrogenase